MEDTWWDGCAVELPLTALESEFTSNGNTYWRLNINGSPTYGLVKPYRDNIPCIVDELKRVFKLPEAGIKKIYSGITPHLLYRVQVYTLGGQILIQEEPHLSEVDLNQPWFQCQGLQGPAPTVIQECKNTIREFYAFRDLIGLTPNNNTIFKLRSKWTIKKGVYKGYSKFHPITQQDNTILPVRVRRLEKNSLLPKPVLTQWFDDISVSDVVCSMTSFNKDSEKIHEKIAEYRNKIERVIHRVDRSMIWISSIICERLMAHYIRATTTTHETPWGIDEFDEPAV